MQNIAAILADAEKKGRESGKAAGAWVIDGNTPDETCREILRQLDEGDPAIYDALPSAPLSGEWADGPLPADVLGWYEMAEDDDAADDVLTAFETGYADGVVEQVETEARARLT